MYSIQYNININKIKKHIICCEYWIFNICTDQIASCLYLKIFFFLKIFLKVGTIEKTVKLNIILYTLVILFKTKVIYAILRQTNTDFETRDFYLCHL